MLYVDDEPALLDIGKEFLEKTGTISVDTAHSVNEAKIRLSANYYDAIVSDYQMPMTDGIQFLKYIRNSFGNLPFILFTGKGREEVVIEAINNGVDFYLQKGGKPAPQFTELEHKIKQAVFQKRAERQIKESEERYRALFENANDAIFLMDRDVYIDCNKRASDLFDCTKEDLIASPPTNHSPERQPDGMTSAEKSAMFVQQALTGEPVVFEWRHKRYDGFEFDAEVSLTRLNVEGRDRLIAIVRDISERKQAECALQESAQLMNDIISFLPDATFAINSKSQVIAWNQSMEKLTGIPAADMIGKGDYEYAVPLYGERRPVLIDLIMSHDESGAVQYDAIHRDGAKMFSELFFPNLNGSKGAYLWFTASPLIDTQGKVIGGIESIRDITAHKNRERELREAYEKVAAMEEELRTNFEDLAAREKALAVSEAKFRSLFSAMIEGNAFSEIIYDTNGKSVEYRILEVNPAFEKIFGISKENAIGKTSSEVFGICQPEALDVYSRVAETGIPRSFEVWYPPMKKYFAISVYSPMGKTFATVFEDITNRKQQELELRAAYEQIAAVEEELRNNFEELGSRERALRESEERYRRVIETANEGIWILDDEFRATFVNSRLTGMLGYTADEMIGHPITEFTAPGDLPDHEEKVRNRHIGAGDVYERKYRHKDGNAIWCLVSAVPLKDTTGTFSGSFAMLTDITARKTAEEELRLRNKELRESNEHMAVALEELKSAEESLMTRNRELEQQRTALLDSEKSIHLVNRKLTLLSSITRHDVLNQLTAMDGYVDLSAPYSLDTRFRNLLEKEHQLIDRIRRHITFTREYENIGIGAPVWQDIRSVVENATAGLDLSAVSIDLPQSGIWVLADPLLPKVFYNLLDNTLRYGEKASRIRVSAAQCGKELVINCEDDGVGIDPTVKDYLFEKGFGKNTGFGLFLSREILQITGLSIIETGVPGEGAVFRIHVPEGVFRLGE